MFVVKKIAILVLVFIILLSSFVFYTSQDVKADGLSDSPWPKFRGNERNTGLSPYNTSHVDGTVIWGVSMEFSTSCGSSPAIGASGTIYVGSGEGDLCAINPDGTEEWSFSTSYNMDSSPAIGADGTIYIGLTHSRYSFDDKLYAINPDGTEKWSFSTGDGCSSPAIGADGTIYIGSDRNLCAVNPDGTEKWSFSIGDGVSSSPAIGSDGTVYVGSYDHNLYAINPNGTEEWHFTTGHMVESSPAIGSDGVIYVGSWDDKLYAINPDGTEKWNFSTGDIVRSSPAIGSDGTVYVGSRDGKLYAINAEGTEKWKFTTGEGIESSPVIGADGTIYIGSGGLFSEDGKLYAINPDGREKWSFTTGEGIESSLAIGADGTIYFSVRGNLYAVGEGEEETFLSFTSFIIVLILLVGLPIFIIILSLFRKRKKMEQELEDLKNSISSHLSFLEHELNKDQNLDGIAKDVCQKEISKLRNRFDKISYGDDSKSMENALDEFKEIKNTLDNLDKQSNSTNKNDYSSNIFHTMMKWNGYVNYKGKWVKKEEKDKFVKKKELEIGLSNNFTNYTPYEFEKKVAELFKKIGYDSVETTKKSGDFGIDVIAKNDEELVAIQVKKYSAGSAVGINPVQRTMGAMHFYNADRAIFITTSSYTSAAKAVERTCDNLELWGGRKIKDMFRKYFIDSKIEEKFCDEDLSI
ncbi:MAG: PQQ-binding-like beta-propeller repeat protein [Thermoplasmata archaeon]